MKIAQKKTRALTTLALLAGLSASCGGSAPEVQFVRVARENLGSSITSNGKVEPVEPHSLRAQMDTFVERVAVAEGRRVRKGELLLTLDGAAARAALARARQDLLDAEEKLRVARSGGPAEELAQVASDIRKTDAELERLRKEREALTRLLAKQAATQDELDQNRLALERAEAQAQLLRKKKDELARRAQIDVERASLAAERARSEVRSLEEKVRSAELRAPVDGTLYALPVRAGDFVRTGDLLAEVAALERVRVRVFVDEPEMGALEAGQAVEITWDALPGRSWPGRTENVPASVVTRGSRSVGEVLCTVENAKIELLPNTNVNVVIRIKERAGVLTVPRGAVRGEGTARYVFILDGSTLRRRDVKLGMAGTAKFEVLEGLKEGDRIALPGEAELKDGLAVKAVEQR
ncbi:MAG TPA: efflux RND transporter periplasmic adaptor subunit [Candidatus Nitrosotenuis sp.]|nr:efflux RND transporter periplasmic adaptor subunit [Candidatus Nitrosotenuis sp.]